MRAAMEPIRMKPAYRYAENTPWGGDGLKTLFHRDIPDERTGESLEISALPGLESTAPDGRTLTELLRDYGELLTGSGTEAVFPLLLKLLCAKTQLSVQVHPDDSYAAARENKLGKTEAWVILHAEEGASILYGLRKNVSKEKLERALLSGEDVEPLIQRVSVKPGDVFYIPSGMVHAIGGGIVLYEIQQSSDITYRLWDYNRTNAKGEKRPLHIRQSLDVIQPGLKGMITRIPEAHEGITTLLDVPAFRLDCLSIRNSFVLKGEAEHFRIFTALCEMTLRWGENVSLKLQGGDSLLLPAHGYTLTLSGKGRALIAEPGNSKREHTEE